MKYQIMDRTGHSTMDFTENEQSMARAKKIFDDLLKKDKMTAAERKGPGQLKVVREFNPDAEEVVFFPPLQGG